MSTQTIFLSRLLGLWMLLLGATMLIRGSDFAYTIELLTKDLPLMFVAGMTALAVGLAIIIAHNVWSGNAAAILVTVIGWLSALKGVVILVVPAEGFVNFVEHVNVGAITTTYTAIFLIIGVYLTYVGYRVRA
jgi:hypothetical protein